VRRELLIDLVDMRMITQIIQYSRADVKICEAFRSLLKLAALHDSPFL